MNLDELYNSDCSALNSIQKSKLTGKVDLRTFKKSIGLPVEHPEIPQIPNTILGEYASTSGTPLLTQRIALEFKVRSEEILVTDGASQALFLALSAARQKSKYLLLPIPWFPAYYSLAKYLDFEIETYSMLDEIEALLCRIENIISERPTAIVINTPHNPTGITLSDLGLNCLENLAKKFQAYPIWDFAYVGYSENAIQPEISTGITIYSLGKYLCQPGLRCGFLTTRSRKTLEKLTSLKRNLVLHSSIPDQFIASELLDSAESSVYQRAFIQAINSRTKLLSRSTKSCTYRANQEAAGPFILISGADDKLLGVSGGYFGAPEGTLRVCTACSKDDWKKLKLLIDL